MKLTILSFLLGLLSVAPLVAENPTPPMTTSFDYDWLFTLSDAAGAESPAFVDSGWRKLNLPHDWSIELTPSENSPGRHDNGFFPGGIGWYRKHFTAPPDAKDKRVILQFDGVYMNCRVFLNGHFLAERPYGYASFQCDLTPWLKATGDNVLAVRVDHSAAPTSRWYSGSGIYRHVWLSVLNPLRVARWGTFVTTPTITPDAATVQVQTQVQNDFIDSRTCTLVTSVTDAAGQVLAQMRSDASVAPGTHTLFTHELQIPHPQLWSPEEPTLYFVQTTVREGTKDFDSYRTPFGIRSIVFDATHGFSINGQHVKLKGVCLHDDAGSVGVAVPEQAWRRRLDILRGVGCNAIRLSHNPPAPEFLDLCDQMGFLVLDEAFDKWKSGYYKNYFDHWWQEDLDAMLLRDRNHPSIILWGVGNEVVEQGTPEGTQRLKMLVDYTHRTDPSRLVTCAMHPSGARLDSDVVNGNGFADAADIASYNYQEQWFDIDKAAHPNRIVLSTESYPYYMGASAYDTKNKLFNEDCAFTTTNPWYTVRDKDYVVGEFIWSGIDYLGESTGWPSKGWCNGIIDTCGFLKPRAGFFRSIWSSQPMVEIAVQNDAFSGDPGGAAWSWPGLGRTWNFPQTGQILRVQTFTNCRTVELFLNEKSLGLRQTADYPNQTITWNVPYHAGSLRAVAGDGTSPLAHDDLTTAGEPVRIELLPDRTTLAADGHDIVNVEVRLVDATGNLVPDSDHLLKFALTGPGKLAGLDNGDLRSAESYRGNHRSTFLGRELAIVQSGREAGAIVLSVQGDHLPRAEIHLKSDAGSIAPPLSERR